MEYLTNCKNCNAPLYYDDEDYAKCQYCGTEYHYDKIYKKKKSVNESNIVAKQIDDRMIEIEIYGEKRRFYIAETELFPTMMEEYIGFDPYISSTRRESCYKMKLRLIEY